MTDEITLTLPAGEGFEGVAHLVIGGLAARLDLTFESLEDLQIALDGLLGRYGHDDEVTVAVTIEDAALRAAVGPDTNGALEELEGDESPLGLRRVLETVCDGFEVERRDSGEWACLTKAFARVQ